MDLQLNGRTVLVCASTGGLGEAVARAVAAEGANVVVSGRRGERAREIAAELEAAGAAKAVGVEVDLTADGGADALHAAAVEAFGGVDVLVLNGPGPKPGTADTVDAEAAEAAVRTLVSPHVRLVQLALPRMREQKWGRVLAVGSSGVQSPIPSLALSNLGRAALAGYLKTLASEVAADGVTVNMLLPGRIATDRVASLDEAQGKREGTTAEEAAAKSKATIPAGRYGDPAEFGAAAAFLVSGPASYVTGVALRCDGGMVRSL
ncbi:SDR family oxidoreductase [Thalassiella azotivora]